MLEEEICPEKFLDWDVGFCFKGIAPAGLRVNKVLFGGKVVFQSRL